MAVSADQANQFPNKILDMAINIKSEKLFLACRIILGAVFIYAGWIKIIDPLGFAKAIYNYRIFPDLLISPAAIIIPWIELITGILLICGVMLPGAILVSTILLSIFTAVLATALSLGIDISCGCFSTGSSDPATISTLFRDSIFLAFSFYLFWYKFSR